jgi:hypothetical protein
MVLDRNPKNYFAEVEQSAFSPANLVPGIEPSPDKMLQVTSSIDNVIDRVTRLSRRIFAYWAIVPTYTFGRFFITKFLGYFPPR